MVPKHVIVGLIQEHPHECELFNMMVKDMELNPMLVKKVIALWLALGDYGYQDFTKAIRYQDNQTISQFFQNGLAILESIKPNATPIDPKSELRCYYKERKSIYKSYSKILFTLCNNIFGEYEALEVVKRGDGWVIKEEAKPFGEGSSGCAPGPPEVGCGEDQNHPGSCLNPDALEFHGRRVGWNPLGLNPNAPQYQPVATREVFVAFRYGGPLTVPEIANYFNEWLSAPVVESVNVIMPPPGHPPLSAVVAFIDASAVTVVLGGGSSARHITTDGREMWASAYGRFSSLQIY
ncbi:DNA-directed RNA polymerase II subunit like [Actinidia chinensis var. chinensis]|uniref:DNA-directed RNA polymerase II subunit like n=1 Tax=Actinidia chinensis var. chinensis TaxID=1590841 RepID=A0A2R6QNQ8_ACTCC|nr:DNA-directed RNA polymerase II subunit like [Actinidia chinensis var. chinensis]